LLESGWALKSLSPLALATFVPPKSKRYRKSGAIRMPTTESRMASSWLSWLLARSVL